MPARRLSSRAADAPQVLPRAAPSRPPAVPPRAPLRAGIPGTDSPIPGQQPGLAPTPDDGKKPKREHRGAKALILGIAGGVLGAGLLTGVLLGTGVIGRGGSATFNTGTNQSIIINPSDENTSTATAVAAKALPSVCTVTVTTSDGTGEGSGVIYDNDGDIITNNHVIEDAESISVTINGQNYDATLVGTDASSDVAVVGSSSRARR